MRRALAVLCVVSSVVLALSIARHDLATARIRSTLSVAQPKNAPAQARILSAYGKLPLSFEQNQGQTDARVKFLAHGSGYTVFLTGDETTLRLDAPSKCRANAQECPANPSGDAKSEQRSRAVVRLTLAQSNQSAEVEGLEHQPGRSNYLIGNDPIRWRQNVSHFARVKYRGVYPGIDLVYYGNQGQLESDYVVAPGADPNQIGLQIEGAGNLKLDSQGDLVLPTAAGDIFLRHPRAYQDTGTSTQEIAANYVQSGEHQVSIKVGPYDSHRPLIIDPVLSYSTYLGGTLNQFLAGIAADSSGFAYVTGFTSSADFPVTTGSFQTTPKNSAGSAFVTKLSKDGTALVYSTFLGGTGTKGESGHAIAVDSLGDAFVIGSTSSTDFPITTATAYQSINKGGGGFFTELDPTGANLLYSTYLSGSGTDRLQGVAVDITGNAYITGATTSTDFPVIPGTAIQTTNNVTGSQIGTAFLSRIDPTKVGTGSLVYSTYLGGTKEDSGLGVAADASANAYITGYTSSSDFPMTVSKNGFQTTLKNPSGNAFVSRIDTSQPNLLVYSTFLGGGPNGFGSNPGEAGDAIALGPSGNAYMIGISYAPDYPRVAAFDSASNTPFAKTVVSRIDTTKSGAASLVYSTYFGGTLNSLTLPGHGSDLGFGIALDPAGNIYLAGTTNSIDFPTTPGAPQTARAGLQNAFMSELNPAGSAVLFSTYLGGSNEAAYGIALDGATPANAYIAGVTSGNFPTTPGAFQTVDKVTGQNNNDGFAAKLSPGAVTGVFATPVNLPFGNQIINIASSSKLVTLFNDSPTMLTIATISFTGTNAADFSQTNTCGATLAAGASCSINVIFTPSTTTSESATLSISDSDSTSPQSVSLTGTGTPAPAAVFVSPATLSFGNQTVNTSSSPQTATLTNNSAGTLTITGISFTGTNAADFSQTTTCGATLATAANCTISVTFKPTTTGAESATLSIADSDASSPQTASLTGTGTSSTPDFTLSAAPASLTVAAGTPASFTATLTSLNGLTGSVSLTCTGAPVDSTCVLLPTSVALPNGTQTSTGTINTTARTIAPPPNSFRFGPRYPVGPWAFLAIALALLAAWIATRHGARKLAWGFAALSLLALTSCSGFPHRGTPAGAYTLTITASSGNTSHSTTVVLTVN